MTDSGTTDHVRLMCSFGGKVRPRPHDNLLRYVGGDTRIVSVPRTIPFSVLQSKLSKTSGFGDQPVSIKYQLPDEELDALVTVASDEDVENMIDEIERLNRSGQGRSGRVRIFLFPEKFGGDGDGDDDHSRGSSISSLLDGSANRENWFLDSLKNGGGGGGGDGSGGGGLERERSEASSVISEVPDYLFGLESLDHHEPAKPKIRPVGSDTGSPAPVNMTPGPVTPVGTQSMPNLPPVKTKPETDSPLASGLERNDSGFGGSSGPIPDSAQYISTQPVWGNYPGPGYSGYPGYPGHGAQAMHMPVYYMPGSGPIPQGSGPIPQGNFQPVTIRNPYGSYQMPPGQVPIGFHPMTPGSGPGYGGSMRPVPYAGSARLVASDPYGPARFVPGGPNQSQYYGVNDGAMVAGFQGSGLPVSGNEVSGAASTESANGNWMVQT